MDTSEKVKEFILNGGICDVQTPVKSEWICNVIREHFIKKGKYQYNSDVFNKIEELLELPNTNYHADMNPVLSWLVYYNQQYREFDDKINAGYFQLNQKFLDDNVGKKFIFENSQTEYSVKFVGGKAYAVKKYAKNKALGPISLYNEYWVKFI